jgi:ribosomal-protein-alanine N-acetyltransferase
VALDRLAGSEVIETASIADLAALHEIEAHSFPNPQSVEQLAAELANPQARLELIRERGAPIAFASYWLVVPGAQHAAEVHILSIATHPDYRRRGLAAHLLHHALDAGRAIGAEIATLEVRRSNVPAIALYERHGFSTVHVRVGYYQSNREDALVMLASL